MFNVASLRKSERLISSRGHGCFTISPPQLPATATRFPSHGSGRPGLELRTATKLSSAGFEPKAVLTLVCESDALTTRPRALNIIMYSLQALFSQAQNICNEVCSGSSDICLHSYAKGSIRKFCEMCVTIIRLRLFCKIGKRSRLTT